ncbi:CD1375 family protein [Paenibacillus yanchengensis]|uniref:CD1375 family protein n=1 Tax=Paenibacillus yanchengensis TaxID=2035833 RepID=A0ABW4YL14_9BACL
MVNLQPIINVYVSLVKAGRKTIEDVPANIRDEVTIQITGKPYTD